MRSGISGKTYRSTVAVDDVTFSVQERKIFGILSPNGAGKTTTVECIEGPFSVSVNLAMVLSIAAVVVAVTGPEYQLPLPRQFGGFIRTLLLATLALMGIGLCIAKRREDHRGRAGHRCAVLRPEDVLLRPRASRFTRSG